MPLNKLDNFIKNTEGRILYVSPADLDSSDSIDNTGNSLARPFKTIQRALIEAARFSYVQGSNNDTVEKTTVLLMPGEHVVDNRPGWSIFNDGGTAKVTSADNNISNQNASSYLPLTLDSNFDLTQSSNDLVKFNSVKGGVILPRGTSIVGLDLRKTKIRPKYVPNPTISSATPSAIFRVTGACYLWQFSIFDADESETVYTLPNNFNADTKATPTFSHHKLTCFEYADGVNKVGTTELTDLEMYYAKLSHAYGTGSGNPAREIDRKFPTYQDDFAPGRPEFEIVGAFASDPLEIEDIISGDGVTASKLVKVTTKNAHNLNEGTPIRIDGVTGGNVSQYNVSTKVTSIDPNNDKVFFYTLKSDVQFLPANPNINGTETVTVETDTVSGASPYIFNISMRSTWGMNGMHADGSKADGFRSMVVAQFTGISLQKDDRAFVKYNESTRSYDGLDALNQSGSALSSKSSSSNNVYHLDSGAIYRRGWETSHIKITNDAILQIVSVFAIGFNKHFDAESGGDASITNSNSNFGQLSLISEGFKKEAFDKDNTSFLTHLITPKAITETEKNIEWLSIDLDASNTAEKLYIFGFENKNVKPPALAQGFRIGARESDKLYVNIGGFIRSADILMSDGSKSKKEYSVTSGPTANVFTIGTHSIQTGEKVIIRSIDGDLPEKLSAFVTYFAIRVDATTIKLASSKNEADNGEEVIIPGSQTSNIGLKIITRVSDKDSGDVGHPVQYDDSANQWFIKTSSTENTIYPNLSGSGDSNPTYIKRISDDRSIDDKIYKLRVVVPKQYSNAKSPENSFILQESSTTGVLTSTDFTKTSITADDVDYNRNRRFISTCSFNSDTVTVITELPHNLTTGDSVIIRNVKDSVLTGSGEFNKGYNGTFTVTVTDDSTFTYDQSSVTPGTFLNDTSVRDTNLPRFERNDLKSNLYIYRNEFISEYEKDNRNGIYHIYPLKSDVSIQTEFTNLSYSQNVTDLYPQLDRDNINDNPRPSRSYAKRSPLGEVVTNDPKKSLTKESTDTLIKKLGIGLDISSVSNTSTSATITFNNRHGFAGIVTGTVTAGGGSYNNNTYQNVKLLNTAQNGTWNGATARVVVSSGSVNSALIVSPGSGYSDGDILFFDETTIGAGDGTARFTVSGITSAIGQVVQFTGAGTTSDTYHRITAVDSSTQISVAKTAGDSVITSDQYGFLVHPSVSFTANTSTGVVNATAHGLSVGNRVRIIDSSNNNVGDLIVSERTDVDTIKINGISTTSGIILKHGLSANDKVSTKGEENLGVRGITIFDKEYMNLSADVTADATILEVSHSGISTITRFPLGSYIEIDGEIMRVSSDSLGGLNDNELSVIRGVFGTPISSHESGSLVKKIKVPAIEFRRPSILRASGHTFEYLGYGPGNYSTGLPQVQNKTITETEEFLSQAQERSSGVVVYTGMNNRGDFYIGNQKKSSTTGEETTFDTPIPTVTGEDPSKLSVVFDEIIVKQRIIVEGGDSKQILSQFDGPVTINNETRFTNNESNSGNPAIKISYDKDSTGTTSGALVVEGGVGIAKNVNIGGSMFFPDNKRLNFGDGNDLQIYHSGVDSWISDQGDGLLYLRTTGGEDSAIRIMWGTYWSEGAMAGFNTGGSVDLYYNNDLKFATTNTGVNITGTATATTFSGPLTGNVTGNVTGNADTATKLKTARTIGGVSFDGSANINLPGVNVGGNQDTSGNAASASQIKTVTRATNDTHYLTFVDSNNSTSTAEPLYTDAGIYYNPSTNNLSVEGDITAFASSDERLKDNITPIDNPLAKVISISGNTFDWNENSGKEGSDTGVIAQEIEALGLSGLVTTRDNGYKAVRYEKLVPLLIEAIKELSGKVDALEEKLSDK